MEAALLPSIHNTTVHSLDDLLRPFHEAMKPRPQWRVGTEAEKFGIFGHSGQPLPYEGRWSIQTIFDRLVEHHGWFAEREHEGGAVIALRRGDSSITLEPGGQLELSGAPHACIHQTCAELRGHMVELRDVAADADIVWLGMGFHPLARPEQMPWVPKQRYAIMREYLPTRGTRGLDMMQRTATVQANIDYSSEADAMRKLRLALAIQPIITAMFANSPLIEGRIGGNRSERAAVWLDMDPDRAGLLPFAWDEAAGFRDYVEWALDVPMFLIKRGDGVLPNTRQTFRQFMRDGLQGHRATLADWETHLNTLFPETRLKRTIEVRGADSQPHDLVCALPALMKGLFYDERALDAVARMTASLTPSELQTARPSIARSALSARLQGKPVLEWARELLDIAEASLRRQSNLNSQGRDEAVHLARLRRLMDESKCPADALLDELDDRVAIADQIVDMSRA